MSPGRYVAGLMLLLLPLAVCLGVLLGIVALANGRAQQGPVTCQVSRPMVLTGGTVILDVGRAPVSRGAVVLPPPPLDVILVVDQSGSMTQFSRVLPSAVRQSTANLARADHSNRFALVYFSDAYRIVQPWTDDRALITAAAREPLAGGGTQSDQIIAAVNELQKQSPPVASRRTVVILFTDTEFPSPQGVEAGAERLRRAGAQIYVLLTPNEPDHSRAERIAGSAEHVIVLNDETELAERLAWTSAQLLTNAANLAQADAWIHQRVFTLDDAHPLAADWRLESEAEVSATTILSDAGAAFELPLKAQQPGLWTIGERPVQVASLDNRGAAAIATCSHRPMVLVVPLWLWLLALLPALLWTLNALRFWTRKPQPPPAAVPAFAEVEPMVRSLPLPHPPPHLEEQWVPTLLVGVGDRGRRVLEAVRLDLADSPGRKPARLVSLNTRKPGASATVEGIDELVMPGDCAATAGYLPASGTQLPAALRWFDHDAFRDVSRDRLDVAGAGAGDRALNRFALLRWLDNGLREQLRGLGSDFARSGLGGGQVLLVADVAEAFSSACLLDIAGILRAATAHRPVEVTLVLLNDSVARDDANRSAFIQELETDSCIQACRALNAAAPEARAPIDHCLIVPGSGGSTEREAADAVVTVLRRDVARTVYNDARTQSWLQVRAAKVGFRSRDLAQAVANELLQRWIAGSVLGATEPAAQGGYRLKSARAQWTDLAREFLSGSRGRLPDLTRVMLLAAEAQGDVAELLGAIAGAGGQRGDLVRRMSVQLLDTVIMRVGRQGFNMADAVALFSGLIDALGSPEFAQRFLGAGGLAVDLKLLQDTMGPLIVAYCDQLLSTWVPAALERVGRAREVQSQLLAGDFAVLERGLAQKVDRAFIEQMADGANAQLISGQTGADAADWVTLRARLDANQSIVEGRIAIGQYFSTHTPQAFFATLEERAESAVVAVQQYTLAWLLRRRPDSVSTLALDLKLDPGPQARAILIKPGSASFADGAVISQLVDGVPPLVGTSHEATVLESGDPRWVRRTAWAPWVASQARTADDLRPVRLADAAAEVARQRLETLHNVRVPVFPPQVRAAFHDLEAIGRFARLQAQGCITHQLDGFGREQWCLGEVPLTQSTRATLAEALASYVSLGLQQDVSVSSLQAGYAPATSEVDTAALANGEDPDVLVRAILSAVPRGLLS